VFTEIIGIIGDKKPGYGPHTATENAIMHSSKQLGIGIKIEWIPTDCVKSGRTKLQDYAALWAAPGSPYINTEGAISAIQFARENKKVFLGTCGGFQHTIWEYSKNVLGMCDSKHEEISPDAVNPLISRLSCSLVGRKGRVKLLKDSISFSVYKTETIEQEFRCNYGLNPIYYEEFKGTLLEITGFGPENEPRIVELKNHPFFVATAFMPQLTSTETEPDPLICKYLETAFNS